MRHAYDTKVIRFMTPKVVTASPEDGARDAFFRMRTHHIRHLPVVKGGRLVGILSDRDLRRPDWVDEHPDISHVYALDNDIKVDDLMTRDVAVVHTYDRISKAASLMHERRFGALPVLNKDDDLVGILSAWDLLGALTEVLTGSK